MDFISPTDGPYVLYQGKKWLDFSSCDFAENTIIHALLLCAGCLFGDSGDTFPSFKFS